MLELDWPALKEFCRLCGPWTSLLGVLGLVFNEASRQVSVAAFPNMIDARFWFEHGGCYNPYGCPSSRHTLVSDPCLLLNYNIVCCLIQEEPYSENPLHQVALLLLKTVSKEAIAMGKVVLNYAIPTFLLYAVGLLLYPASVLILNRGLCTGAQRAHDILLKVT